MNYSQLSSTDLASWADLLAVSFGRKQSDMFKLLTYLQADQQLLAWGAWDGVRLVAQYSCLLRHLCLPSQTSPALVGMSINMAVHPDYRGQGLIKKVAKPVYTALRERGAVTGVGFSNAAGVQVDRRSKGYGYHVVGQMRPTLVTIWRQPQTKPLYLTTTWPKLGCLSRTCSQQIRFDLSPQLIYRRFAAHPLRHYYFGVRSEKGKPSGVVVYKRFALNGAWQRLNQRGVSLLMAYGEDLDDLLASWLSALWQSGSRFVHLLTTPSSEIRGALQKTAVCIPLPYSRHPYYLTVKPLQADYTDDLLDFKRWDCVGGDIL